ncbi:hypothetical protein LTR10_018131 [Elasticomyces elasticus]|uniref:NAD(P)-binding protein n=1 Tax=Exophiala sideris TaxID=1016849 RepID=A0ABR0IWB6_9EURO|nr:hypothetical protein LTR10_018131 [Elasticomyces elasticus]KAK5021729.1 hypothetical protein LTS07_010771 [Exophiala sideris]KAK5025114.1 hypothetical protein LTR13_010551 [Exophiala sideris]KAK5050161.1 hypothetical protein LTR69_010795 [Exophiala sideris]KAK5176909.1 hypothetical protein LTR44_010605 [Eurotiomycetes sp. CCFEE 6388]
MIKTAIVTGACSGIGLALSKGESEVQPAPQQWRVVLADINDKAYEAIKASLPLSRAKGANAENHVFVRTDVSNWNDMVNLFRAAFEWPGEGQGAIDFVACNAGIDDIVLRNGLLDDDDNKDNEAEAPVPTQPDLRVLQVDLHSNFFATRLLVHYTRKTKRRRRLSSPPILETATATANGDWTPKMVVTASMAAQYPFFLIPQYTAAKHGCLGLVRALSPALLKHEGITLNCVMPGTVDTGLIPQPVLAQWPKEHLTPLDTVIRAYMELIGDWDRATMSERVASDAVDRDLKNGCAVECSADWLWYRDPVPFMDESMRFVAEQSKEEGILGRFTAELKVKMKSTKS